MSNTDSYIKHFYMIEKTLNGISENGILKLKKEAIAKFAEIGFPTTKNEEWKYTNISPFLEHQFESKEDCNFSAKDKISEFNITQGENFATIVFINGKYSKEYSRLISQANEIRIGSLSEILKNEPETVSKFLNSSINYENGFTALNTAFINNGYVINVPDNYYEKIKINVINITSGTTNVLAQTRNIITAGKNTSIKISETFSSADSNAHFTNSVTQIFCNENAEVELYRIQQENNSSFHYNKTSVIQDRNSRFSSYTVTLGGKIVRNDLNPVLNGEGSESNLFGLYITEEGQLTDNHTSIDHTKPNCNSRELYKGVLSGKSSAVFNGKVFVRKDAQKTNAYQSNKNILLSKDARVDTKPQLEIFADDVKCSHGATVGQLEEEALFYLRSRGIGEEKAKKILIRAFAKEVFESIGDESLRKFLNKLVIEKLR